MITTIGIGMAVAVAATLWAEARRPQWRRLWKMAAATGFLVVAVAGEALATRFGTIMLFGLGLAWVGDLALTYRGRTAFLVGLGSFLGGHVAYGVAFLVPEQGGYYSRSLDLGNVLVMSVVLGVLAVVIGRQLLPEVPADLRLPVIAYIIIISAMLALATGHSITCASPCQAGAARELVPVATQLDWRIVGGALLFYVSDLAVARDRFVAPGIVNRMWGLPAYFAGQFLLAWGAGGPPA